MSFPDGLSKGATTGSRLYVGSGKIYFMQDRFGREINYLRISVTDRCNFRCFYCMPPAGITPLLTSSEILSYEEILEIVKTSINLGITRFRITGGEPLVRKDVISLLQKENDIFPDQRLSAGYSESCNSQINTCLYYFQYLFISEYC